MRTFCRAAVLAVSVAAIMFTAAAGVRAYSTSGPWSTASMPIYLNPANLRVSAAAAETAFLAGASAWTGQSQASFSYFYAGRVADTNFGYDGRNVALFRHDTNSGSTLGTTYSWLSGGKLLESDVVFWDGVYAAFTGSSGCSSGYYLEDIATHELGHALGLNHSTVLSATMYPTYSLCSTALRTLDADDVKGVESLYPPPPGTNAVPTVSISSPSSGASVVKGAAVSFSGSSTDREDGTLTTKLVWTSSLLPNQTIGSGGSFTFAGLPVGSQTLTASVSDSGGVTGFARQTITVVDPCANPTVTLAPTPTWSLPTVAQSYTLTVKNNDLASCGQASFKLAAAAPAGWTTTLGAATLSPAPGASASTTVKATAPAGTLAAAYALTASAFNATAPARSGSASIAQNVVTTLGVNVSTAASYALGQNVSIVVKVTEGPNPSANASVTVVVTKPGGGVLKQSTTTTSTSGAVTMTYKSTTPTGTYGVTVTAAKAGISGSKTTTFVVK
jgi:hypothetical protein